MFKKNSIREDVIGKRKKKDFEETNSITSNQNVKYNIVALKYYSRGLYVRTLAVQPKVFVHRSVYALQIWKEI